MTKEEDILLSVIIPTYNRRDPLRQTLESLRRQTYSADCFEVIVVDDGGSDGTDKVVEESFSFRLRYFRQTNQGSAAARNHGVQLSDSELLVFIDDDITLQPGYLAGIADQTLPGVITMGVWQPYEPPNPTCFSRDYARRVAAQAARTTRDEDVPFAECSSNNLALHRTDFLRVGMWQDVLGDGPTLWGDVEFGYRAWKQGYRFVRVADARLVHRDQHMIDLASATRRVYHVSRIVQPLFARHPEIGEHLPMFRDKGPIEWRNDPPTLIAHKLARQIVSSQPVLHGMEGVVRVLGARCPSPAILGRLYRWINSAYIYRGYREGLRNREQQLVNIAGRKT